jgi:anti-sigma regulatory factor (Ser/Thr protein kinase)
VIERREFPRSTESVPVARHFVAEMVGDAPPDVVDRVSVIVSELATNAILHAGTDFAVQVEITPERICVEVSDSGGGQPRVRYTSPRSLSGRGLRIVESLSDDWGVTAHPRQRGKTVWFTLARDR